MEQAALITIGDELLNGSVADRNGSYLARRLTEHGVEVREIRSVPDHSSSIREAIASWEGKVDLLLLTGGLGPTDDDPTKGVLLAYYGVDLERDPQIEQDLKDYLAARGRMVSERDLAQADMPQGAHIIRNPKGSAPGIRFDRHGTQTIALPGVPHEMRALVEEQLLPSLKEELGQEPLPSRSIVTSGLGESTLVQRIEDLVRAYEAKGVRFSYLAAPGTVRIRAMMLEREALEGGNCLDEFVEKLRGRIPDHIVGVGEEAFEVHIQEALRRCGCTLATAESCTGGYIAHLLTSVPGSSHVFAGSVIAYSNDVKKELLGVPSRTLETHGAVSQEVVKRMASGVREAIGSDIGLATSGIMGPSGGTAQKPVGTAWMAVATKDREVAECWSLGQERQTNIEKGGRAALNLLRKELPDH